MNFAAATPTGGDAHIDVPLSNLAIKAFSDSVGMIAQELFPIVSVEKENNKYYVIDKDTWLRLVTTLRSRKAPPRKIEFRVSSDSYACLNYALRSDNAKEDLANADRAIRLRQNSTKIVTSGLLRDYEDRVARQVSSGTNLGSYVSLSGTAKWNDYVNSDPISDVTTGHAFIRQNTGLKANTMVIDEDTLKIVRRHPLLLDMFKYTSGGEVTPDQLKSVFEVARLLVGTGIKNNALENATASITNIWGNNVILAHVDPNPISLETATLGLSMRWQPDNFPAAMQVERYDDADKGTKKEWVEAGYFQDEKIVSSTLGYGILNTL